MTYITNCELVERMYNSTKEVLVDGLELRPLSVSQLKKTKHQAWEIKAALVTAKVQEKQVLAMLEYFSFRLGVKPGRYSSEARWEQCKAKIELIAFNYFLLDAVYIEINFRRNMKLWETIKPKGYDSRVTQEADYEFYREVTKDFNMSEDIERLFWKYDLDHTPNIAMGKTISYLES